MMRRPIQLVFLLLLLLAGSFSFYLKYQSDRPEFRVSESERLRGLAERERDEAVAARDREAQGRKEAEAREAEERKQKEEERRQKEEFKRFVERLEATHGVGQIVVRHQMTSENEPGGVVGETLVFNEVDANGEATGKPQEFQIHGKRAHFEALLIQFGNDHVKKSDDPLKGHSVALFTRVIDEPTADQLRAQPIDNESDTPAAERRSDDHLMKSQKELWGKFWSYTNNPDLCKKDGVKVAQIQSVGTDFEVGFIYNLSVQNNGGLTITPAKLPPAVIRAMSDEPRRPTTAPTSAPASAPAPTHVSENP